MCERKSCRQGKPPQSPAVVAEPRGDVVSKAQAVCTGTGKKLRGLGLLSHRICHIFGNECRISPHLQICLRMAFAFPLCRRSKGTVVALASLTHFPHHPPPPPPPPLGKAVYGTQPPSPLHQGLPAISSCHTHAQQLFWKIALHLLMSDEQMCADPREVATFPGRCLQVLKK